MVGKINEKEKMEAIHSLAVELVDKWFPNLKEEDRREHRIAVLATMKMILKLSLFGPPEKPVEQPTLTVCPKSVLSAEERRKVSFTSTENKDIIIPSGWLGRDAWNNINEKLRKIGFKWVSARRMWVREKSRGESR